MAKTFRVTRPFNECYMFSYPLETASVVNIPKHPIKRWIDPNPQDVVEGWDGQKYARYTVAKMNGTRYVFDDNGFLKIEQITIPYETAISYNPAPLGNIGPDVNTREVPPPLDLSKLKPGEFIYRGPGFTSVPAIGVFDEVVTDTERLISIEKKVDDILALVKVSTL